MSTEVLQQARAKYDRATAAYMVERRNGGITELDPMDPDESDDKAAGAKFKARNPVGAAVLGTWQRAKAELDHAAANVRRERGDKSCPVCKDRVPMGPKEPDAAPKAYVDSRLPVERDEEVEGLL